MKLVCQFERTDPVTPTKGTLLSEVLGYLSTMQIHNLIDNCCVKSSCLHFYVT
jgi:hypothetical protein